MNKLLTLFFSFLSLCTYGQHTFSIVAVDVETGQVGTAGATCLTSADCGGCGGAVIIASIFPGLGCLNSQAQVCIPNSNGVNGMRKMINDGFDAQEALDWLLANDDCQFGGVQDRQYGIAMLNDENEAKTASFTGSNTLDYANHLTGPNYSIQGNILIGPEVLEGMEESFLSASGGLAERLMAAMQGANIPGADSRCLPDGISSRSAFIKVAKPEDNPGQLYLDLNVPDTDNNSEPIDSLQNLFNNWFLTSNEELSFENAISVFPNPASSKINVKIDDIFLNGSCNLTFYNEMGQLVYQTGLSQKLSQFNLEEINLKNGIYIFKIEAEGNMMRTGRLLIVNE